jgi:photosystem II stability/assembly factor-like uncharacterized protein
MSDFITSGEGNFFVQLDRTVRFDWLTCSGVNDVDMPRGDSTVQTTADPLRSGQFKIDGFIRGTPGAGTYSLVKPLATVYNFLIEQRCDFVGRINWVCRGTRQEPSNYEIAAILHGSEPDRSRIRNPVAGTQDADARVGTEMDISFTGIQMVYPISLLRNSLTNTNDAYAVKFLPEQCDSRCGPGRGACMYGAIGLDGGVYAYDSEIKITQDGGVNVAEAAADPYTYGGITRTLQIVENVNGPRIIVFRGVAVSGFPAECAYSEDHGATWTNVTVGAVGMQYFLASAFNGANLFATTNDGYIYRSRDLGATWAVVEAGVITANDIVAITFADDNKGYAVGESNIFMVTTNGGSTWAAVTGPSAGVNLLSVACNDKGHVFVGNNAAEIWVSRDYGATWTRIIDHAAGSIDWIEFDPEFKYVGAYIWNDATPDGLLYRSEDGGASWALVPGMPANDGLNAGHICDPNNIVVVGPADAATSTTFMAKATS